MQILLQYPSSTVWHAKSKYRITFVRQGIIKDTLAGVFWLPAYHGGWQAYVRSGEGQSVGVARAYCDSRQLQLPGKGRADASVSSILCLQRVNLQIVIMRPDMSDRWCRKHALNNANTGEWEQTPDHPLRC